MSGGQTPTPESRPRPVVLCVLDGWGWRPEPENNAIAAARTPNYDRLLATCPHGLLRTAAGDVGLPEGQMGNSEVGHMNMGAGRVVLQDLPRIDGAIADGSLARSPALGRLIAELGRSGGACHLMGLLSPGGVHAHQRHIAALARYLAEGGVQVRLHAFLDGRDTPPASARGYAEALLEATADLTGFAVATVSGRYYAMDRDQRWERLALAYQTIAEGRGAAAPDLVAAIDQAYAAGERDEFVIPRVIAGYPGMADGDGVLMANFRADRVRQLLSALLEPAFDGFERPRPVSFAGACGMSDYGEALGGLLTALVPTPVLANTLGEVVAGAGLRQLRLAETEKYAHVTYFLNGGIETPFDGEERILVPSPKVASYDLKPEMSAGEVTERLTEAVRGGRHDLIVVNYANADMVGHSGDLEAAMAAVEAIDGCLGRLAEALAETGGVALVTADHGNAETMRDPESAGPHTAHTTNLVPAILVNPPRPGLGLREGRLADVAPTLLGLLGLPVPAEMSGESLVVPEAAAERGRVSA
jgi:2,3-bisphosphoglycerate-independent phosphoglycerate mutase